MRKRTLLSMLAVIGIVSAVISAPAGAGRPTFNPVCLGTKIEGGQSGTYAIPYGDAVGVITITVQDTEAGPVFDFDTGNPQHVVGFVDVKGGTSLLSYSFVSDATPNGVTSATGLHADLNPSSGQWYGISYLCFGTGFLDGGGGGSE